MGKAILKSLFSILIFTSFSSFGQAWMTAYNQGVEDYNNYDLVSAKTNCETALEVFTNEFEENHKNTAAILRQLTLICYEDDLLEEGIKHSQREQSVLKAIGESDKLIYGTSLYNQGLILVAMGKYQESLDILSRAVDLHLVYLDENDIAVADVRGVLAGAYFYAGDLENAGKLFQQSLNVLDQQNEASPEFFNITYSYSEYQISNNQPERAVESLLTLTEFYDEINADINYGSLLLKLGTTYELAGNMTSAKDTYRKANDIFKSIGAESEIDNQRALSSLTNLLINEGSINEATIIMEDLVSARMDSKGETYYTAVANLGNIYFTNLQIDQAAVKYQEVLDYYESNEASEAYYIAVNGIALVELEKGQYSKAISEIDRALNLAGENSKWIVPLLKSKARALRALGKYNDSQLMLETALEKSTNDNEQLLDIKMALASLYTSTHELDKARQYLEEVKGTFEQRSESAKLQYASFLGVYANYLQESGNYLEAENALNASISLKKMLLGEKNENYLSTYESLGILYLTKGKYLIAQDIFEEIHTTKNEITDVSKASLAYTKNNLGVVKKYEGEYTASEDFFKEALELYADAYGKDQVYYANTSNEMGLLYMKMGNLKSAEPRFLSAMKVYEKIHGKNHVEYASALENLAALYSMQGEAAKSKKVLEEVLEIDKVVLGTLHPLYSKTLHNLASTLEELGEYEQASRLYEESIKIYQELFGNEHPSYANTLYNIAVLEQEIGNFEGAKAHYLQVIEIRKKILNENHPDLAYSVFGLASVRQKLGDWEGAREDYEFVINSYLKSIVTYFPSLSEQEKSAFYAKIKPVFEAYQDFAIEYVTTEKGNKLAQEMTLSKIYDLQLTTKALLLNSTNKVKNRILSSGDASLISKYQEWISLKEDLVKALNMSNADLAINQIDIATIQAKSNDAEKELSRMSESFSGEYEKKELSWKAVRDYLSADEAAIEILRVKKNTKNDSIYYAILVLKGNEVVAPELVLVKDGDNLEGKFFKQYKNLIVFKMENTRSYAQFWAPIDEALIGVKKVYISSDGVYNKININTLYDPTKNEYVFDKYSISLLSNTRELIETKPESVANLESRAAIFGYPDYELGGAIASTSTEAATERGFENGISELPGTLEEIQNITFTLNQHSWTYDEFQREEANETNIKKVDSPTLLHVATHGFFMSTINMPEGDNAGLQSREAKFNPLFRSGLLLAGAAKTFRNEKLDEDEDGILTAYEAMNLNLDKTELVVMSACETGLGEVKNGEGVYGLQRAFIVAGADNLIMSLWKVNDETTQKLMSRFYSRWVGGKSKQEAFHDAIESLKKEYKEPYFWGAFVMLGK
ncbi:MAG: tetratricopeptide repeat protein [Reichenbachiella sp.]